MNRSNNSDCPDQQTLLQFIQGRLEPPKLTDCESHLSDCETCHETLRGLDTGDTLSQYVSDALKNSKPADSISDTQAIDGLMQRLLQPNAVRSSSLKKPSADAEIMADRAAEVLRCIETPAIGDEESLGRLGDYELLRLIGAGGTGVVFMAKDRTLDRMVALKVLRPSLGPLARDRFIAEARLAASIEHDNIVTIYQIGQQDRLAFIAMQWLPGETLEARLIRESGPLHESTVREFVVQIAAGLSAAHERQLIHRDIKPANIWICEDDDRIKILDFGLARVTDEDSSFTQTGMLAGTPNFMSPEQARGLELDPRSDLFSLGCVMYQMLTGKLPFSAPTILATLQTIQSESPQSPIAANHDCSADLSDLTMSLLEKQPGNRLASAQNLVACLQSSRTQWPQAVAKVVGTGPVPSPVRHPNVAGTGSVPPPSSKALRWAITASLLGLISIVGWLMAPQIFRIATNQGELVIETSDENIKIQVLENGDLVRVLDASTKDSFDIQSGEYSFNVVSQDNQSEFEVTPKSVKMTRGGKQLVAVTIVEAKPKEIVEIGTVSTVDSGATVFPHEAFTIKDSTSVYGLNSKVAKTTGLLSKGEMVEVYKQTSDGWCAIRPPKGSVSYLRKSAVCLDRNGEGPTVAVDKARVWVGTSSMNIPLDKWNPLRHSSAATHSGDQVSQVELNKGDRVSIVAEVHIPVATAGNIDFKPYYQIEPPSGEFRWVRQSDLKVATAEVRFEELDPEQATVSSPEITMEMSTLQAERQRLLSRYTKQHPAVFNVEQKIAALVKSRRHLTDEKETPIYRGQNFDQWLRIAKTDREPKTVSDAIAACSVLAEGEQKEQFIALLRQLARRHGRAASLQTTNGGQTNTTNIYFTGLLKAIDQLEPTEVSNFIQVEIESGNEYSLGFCSGIFRHAFFNGDGDKRKEFSDQLLDMTPLLTRIRDGKIKLDWNLQPFFSLCFRQAKTEVDLELCKDTIKTLDVEERPSAYRTFTEKFNAGELDSMIESDFLADSTDGVTREGFIHSLKYSGYGFGGGGLGGMGGGGFHNAPVVEPGKRALLNRLLMESIVRTLDKDKPKLKFKRYQYIYFTDDRVVTTSEGQNGEMYWQSKDQGLIRKKPEGMSKAQGTAAIIRNLITELCQIASVPEPLQDNERDELVAFIKELTESNKAYKDLATTTEFGNLKIPEDLTALLKVVNGNGDKEGPRVFGDEDNNGFSYFVPKNSGGGFGGGGGGGVF